ncbi:MAG: hypothetical protein QOD39_3063 [Mycobacterium sp.]|jgi:hypothetical protein|nr:hypothetical protein [Mycobacterium sp.]
MTHGGSSSLWRHGKPLVPAIVVVVGALSACHGSGGTSSQGEATSTTTAPAPAPAFSQATLDHTTGSLPDLGKLIGESNLKLISSTPVLNDNSAIVDHKDCMAVAAIGEKIVYAGSGFTAARTVVAESAEDSDNWQHVEQSAVIFPSTDAAKQFFDKSAKNWADCVNVPVTLTYPNQEPVKSIGNEVVTMPNSVIYQSATIPDTDQGWSCPHAMAVQENLVVEASICRADASDEPPRIIEQMLKNATK